MKTKSLILTIFLFSLNTWSGEIKVHSYNEGSFPNETQESPAIRIIKCNDKDYLTFATGYDGRDGHNACEKDPNKIEVNQESLSIRYTKSFPNPDYEDRSFNVYVNGSYKGLIRLEKDPELTELFTDVKNCFLQYIAGLVKEVRFEARLDRDREYHLECGAGNF